MSRCSAIADLAGDDGFRGGARARRRRRRRDSRRRGVGDRAACARSTLYDVPAHRGERARRQPRDSAGQEAHRNGGAVRRRSGRYVHWGSTSQDVIDTAMVLVDAPGARPDRRAISIALVAALLDLAERHGDAPMLARTLMQPAQVVSFGFKLAAWIAPLVRARERLRDARARGAAVAARRRGRHAVGDGRARAGGRARAWRAAAASRAGRGAWHTQRDEWVALGCEVGVLCGSLGKIGARHLADGARPRSASSPSRRAAGRGGSSAMPHKRNPVAAMVALAAALRAPQRVAALLAAMPQEHERGLGNWQAELAEWPGLFIAAHGALQGARRRRRRACKSIAAACATTSSASAAPSSPRRRRRCSPPSIGKAKAHALLGDAVARAAQRARRPARSLLRARRRRALRRRGCRRARRRVRRRCRRAPRRRARARRSSTAAARALRFRTQPAPSRHEHRPTSPERSDDFDRGVKNRRAVLGDDWVDRSLAQRDELQRRFPEPHHALRVARHLGPARASTTTTRRLLVLGMTMGLARWEEFELHCRAAIRGGVTLEQIKETLMQGAIYCGVPAANTAFKITLRHPARRRPRAGAAAALRPARASPCTTPSARRSCTSRCRAQGPPVVLSHALGLDLHMWDALAARLAATHTVLRYDHRGHGGSARAARPVHDGRARRRRGAR